mgnify:CR=1 FL=1
MPIEIGKDALSHQEGGSHYRGLKIQPIEYIHANDIPFAEGSVIKYVTRWRDKGGIPDLRKARHFIDLLIELEERKVSEFERAVAEEPDLPEITLGVVNADGKKYPSGIEYSDIVEVTFSDNMRAMGFAHAFDWDPKASPAIMGYQIVDPRAVQV